MPCNNLIFHIEMENWHKYQKLFKFIHNLCKSGTILQDWIKKKLLNR